MLAAIYVFGVDVLGLRRRAPPVAHPRRQRAAAGAPTASSTARATSSSRRRSAANFPFTITYQALRDIVVVLIYVWFFGLHHLPVGLVAEPGQAGQAGTEPSRRARYGRPLVKKG